MSLRNRKNSNKRSKKLFGGSANVAQAGIEQLKKSGLPVMMDSEKPVSVTRRDYSSSTVNNGPGPVPDTNPIQPTPNPTGQHEGGARRRKRRSQKRSTKRRPQRQRQQKSRKVTKRKQRQSNKRQRRK